MISRRVSIHVVLALIVAIACSVVPRGAHAATFVVDSTADGVDAAPGNGACATSGGACTLRAAVQETNALAGADTITLPAGTYMLTIAGVHEDLAATGDLDVRDTLTIDGAGTATTIVDANHVDRGFEILSVNADPVTLRNLTIRNGSRPGECGGAVRSLKSLVLTDVVISDSAAGSGGGLCNESASHGSVASAQLLRVTVTGNTAAAMGGGIFSFVGAQGPFGVPFGSANISLIDSVVAGNAAFDGGGISAAAGVILASVVDVAQSTIRDNVATRGGGGIDANPNFEPTIRTRDTTISGNSAESGGGLAWGNLDMARTTVSGNVATLDGGGFAGSTGTIDTSTISGNRSGRDGGGIHAYSRGLMLRDTTVTANLADADANGVGDGGGLVSTGTHVVSLGGTIIGGNHDNGGERPDCSGEFKSDGHNLVTSTAGCLIGGDLTGNVDGLDPELAPLASNGGATMTHALVPGSPATDVGSGCGAVDQRGVVRPQGAACDIGAFEASPVVTNCGNGVIDGGEACDDGNTRDGDCCSHTCQLESNGSPCSDGNPCTDDVCDGAGACLHSNNTAPCTDVSVCTPTDMCSGGSCVSAGSPLDCDDHNDCTADSCDPDAGCTHHGLTGASCDDGNACTSADTCSGSVCTGTPNSAPCDDGNVCTTGDHCQAGSCVTTGVLDCSAPCQWCDQVEGCVVEPRNDCRELDRPGGSRVQLKDNGDDTRDTLLWQWKRTGGTAYGEFADPQGGGEYEFCIFDENAGLTSLVLHARPTADTCGSKPCWSRAAKGWIYRDKSGSADGLTSVKLKASYDGTRAAKLSVQGKGTGLVMPTLPMSQDPKVTAELRIRSGPCWSAHYHTADKNTAAQFKARSD